VSDFPVNQGVDPSHGCSGVLFQLHKSTTKIGGKKEKKKETHTHTYNNNKNSHTIVLYYI